jgi:hypothetical protein
MAQNFLSQMLTIVLAAAPTVAQADCLKTYQANVDHAVALSVKRGLYSTLAGAGIGAIVIPMSAESEKRRISPEDVQTGLVVGGALIVSTTAVAAKSLTTELSASTSKTQKRQGYERVVRILTQAETSYATGVDLDQFVNFVQTRAPSGTTADDVVKVIREYNQTSCPKSDAMLMDGPPLYEDFAKDIIVLVCQGKATDTATRDACWMKASAPSKTPN